MRSLERMRNNDSKAPGVENTATRGKMPNGGRDE